MSNTLNEDFKETEQALDERKKEPLTVRINKSLKNKIKYTLQQENKSPDDLFSEMYTQYILNNSKESGTLDFTKDIEELEFVYSRISTIFKNMIEKSLVETLATKQCYEEELEKIKLSTESLYKEKLDYSNQKFKTLEDNFNKLHIESTKLLENQKSLKEHCSNQEKNLLMSQSTIENLEKQIKFLEKENETLLKENKTKVDATNYERQLLEKDKEIVALGRQHQTEILSLTKQLNELTISFSNQKEKNK